MHSLRGDPAPLVPLRYHNRSNIEYLPYIILLVGLRAKRGPPVYQCLEPYVTVSFLFAIIVRIFMFTLFPPNLVLMPIPPHTHWSSFTKFPDVIQSKLG